MGEKQRFGGQTIRQTGLERQSSAPVPAAFGNARRYGR